MSVSAMSLVLSDSNAAMREADWISLIYAALESGINAFEVTGRVAGPRRWSQPGAAGDRTGG